MVIFSTISANITCQMIHNRYYLTEFCSSKMCLQKILLFVIAFIEIKLSKVKPSDSLAE